MNSTTVEPVYKTEIDPNTGNWFAIYEKEEDKFRIYEHSPSHYVKVEEVESLEEAKDRITTYFDTQAYEDWKNE